MTAISINVEVLPTTSIFVASHDAMRLAEKLGITVTFEFNGVYCMAVPGDDWAGLADECLKQMELRCPYKVARATKRAKKMGEGFSG